MQVGYCRLVTISTDNLLETNEFRAGVGAHWTFLSECSRNHDTIAAVSLGWPRSRWLVRGLAREIR
jgi:hypothetical protein